MNVKPLRAHLLAGMEAVQGPNILLRRRGYFYFEPENPGAVCLHSPSFPTTLRGPGRSTGGRQGSGLVLRYFLTPSTISHPDARSPQHLSVNCMHFPTFIKCLLPHQ